MNRALILRVFAIGLLATFGAHAIFVHYETQKVPISRLFTNFQQRLVLDTNNFDVTYDLARLHSMAYAISPIMVSVKTNDGRPQFYSPGSDSGVPSGVVLPESIEGRGQALRHLTNAIQLYRRAIALLKASTNNTPYQEWLVLPLELGYAWCVDQSGSRKEAIAAYRKVLTLAWKREVTGEFSFSEWVRTLGMQ